MKNLLIFIFIIAGISLVYSQQYDKDLLKKNEKLVFSFKLSNGKICSIIESADEEYLVYRFGTPGKIELEFPKSMEDSWKQFTYTYYLRGGAGENDGMDLNYLYFTNNNFKYEVYEEYSSSSDTTVYGIKITNLENKKLYDLQGADKTKEGSLVFFRNNEKVNYEEYNQ